MCTKCETLKGLAKECQSCNESVCNECADHDECSECHSAMCQVCRDKRCNRCGGIGELRREELAEEMAYDMYDMGDDCY